MRRFRTLPFLGAAFAISAFSFAQPPDPPPAPQAPPAQDGGWRRMTGGQPQQPADPPPAQTVPANPPLPQTIPPQLTIKPGTYITVRLNQFLSSDHNQPGDAFSATLVSPVIVDGVIVSDRGQTLGGKVTEAKKAGRVQGTSRLGIQLTDLPIVDGQQVPIQTSFFSRNGPTTVGRDAGAIAGTTALGAAIGAAADWGRGAAIGAGAGAVAGIVGVLLTRGAPTIIPPEAILTFRIEQPVTISTEHAPQAFRFVEPGEYNAPTAYQRRPAGPGYAPAPAYYAPAYGYPYPYPYYWGGFYPAIGFYWGPGYYYRGYGYRGYAYRGFHR